MAERDHEHESEAKALAASEDSEPSYRSAERFNLIGRLVWALILVWVGGVLLADNLGLLVREVLSPMSFPWSTSLHPTVWRWLFLGAGGLLGLGVIARLLFPRYREDIVGNLILVIVCFGLGFDYVDLVWPLILIAIGVVLLLKRGFF